MKPKIILAIVAILTSVNYLKAVEVPLSPTNDRPTTRTLTVIPATVDYTDSILTTEFLYIVGTAVVTVTDNSGVIVSQTTVNATQGTVVTTSTEFFTSGTYKITIQIGTKSYSGYFDVVN